MQITGWIEGITRGEVAGWVSDEDRPERQLVLELQIEGQHVAMAPASIERPDLVGVIAGGNDARAFSIAVPHGKVLDRSKMAVRIVGTDATLPLDHAPGYEGVVDFVSATAIGGWAWNVGYPGKPLGLILLQDGKPVHHMQANHFRQDLLEAAVGNGKHAFLVDLDSVPAVDASRYTALQVAVAETGMLLFDLWNTSAQESEFGTRKS